MVVAAMNECPCGYRGHPRQSCRCTRLQIARYRQKLSGPLLDRLDVHVALPPVEIRVLSEGEEGEASSVVRERVVAARARQLRRYERGETRRRTNAELSLAELNAVAPLDAEGRKWLESAAEQLGLSARAYVKVLRVARTVADLAGSEQIAAPHVSEAIQGRLIDRRQSQPTEAA
jgi:magnesium chelatase family protein